jgi:hypothetical protein
LHPSRENFSTDERISTAIRGARKPDTGKESKRHRIGDDKGPKGQKNTSDLMFRTGLKSTNGKTDNDSISNSKNYTAL